MRRTELARLLSSGQPASAACLRAVLAGASFDVDDRTRRPVPASHLATIYVGRQRHTAALGIPTLGFPETVEALRRQGDRPVRLGSVAVANPPYHYQLFLDEALSTVVGVIGVDQRLEGHRDRKGSAGRDPWDVAPCR